MFNRKAFTLSELMVVIAVTAILMAVAVPTFIGARNRSNASACRANLQIINSAIKEWALDNPATAIANYAIKVSDITSYIDSGFFSLDDPVDGRYQTGPGANNAYETTNPSASDDVVVTIEADGDIPNPVCSKVGTYTDHVL